MAKTRTKAKQFRKKSSGEAQLHSTSKPQASIKANLKPRKPIAALLAEAATHLAQSQPDLALPLATSAIARLSNSSDASEQEDLDASLPAALCLLAEIQLELGEADSARGNYERAVGLDPQGALGAEVWFALAQLSEVGGRESVRLYEVGVGVLGRKIGVRGSADGNDESGKGDADVDVEDEDFWAPRQRLADALCAMVEVYMTDLSWEEDAERRCEELLAEATGLCPSRAGVLQTLASVRISQERDEEAREILLKSMQSWNGPSGKKTTVVDGGMLDAEDDGALPDFATRISLVRLLLEVGMEQEAVQVCEHLVSEDDESVEASYLNGWGRVLLAGKTQDELEVIELKKCAKESLNIALRLFQRLDYEDDRLRDHALELVRGLEKEVGVDDEDWEDEELGEDDTEVEFNDFDPDLDHDHSGDMDTT